MKTRWALNIPNNRAQGDLKHPGFLIKINQHSRSAYATKDAVCFFRVGISLQITLTRCKSEIIAGNTTPGGKRCPVNSLANGTMAVTEIYQFTTDFIVNAIALTATLYHDEYSFLKTG
jgi:hypothetical protein